MGYDDFGVDADNPYRASESAERPEYRNDVAPTSVTVFGILNIVFGVIGICGTGFSFFSLFQPRLAPGSGSNPMLDLLNNSPGYRMFLMISLSLGVIATVVLIIAGIGLLTGKPMGQSLSVIYGWYGVFSVFVGLIANIVWVFGPLMQQIQQAPAGPAKAGAIGGLVGGSVGLIIGLIYPVLLLVFMKRPATVEYFRNR